jgi:hypothetical protein
MPQLEVRAADRMPLVVEVGVEVSDRNATSTKTKTHHLGRGVTMRTRWDEAETGKEERLGTRWVSEMSNFEYSSRRSLKKGQCSARKGDTRLQGIGSQKRQGISPSWHHTVD